MNKKLICMLVVIGVFSSLWITNGVLGGEKGFPTKRVEIVSPWGAGGSTSIGGRIIAGTLSEFLEVPVVVINKTGGGGSVGAGYVAKSKPDGYTLLIYTAAANVIMPNLRSVPYSRANFEELALYGSQELPFVVKNDAPWKTLQELVADAKKNPGKLKFATPGIGTSSHFSMEIFKSAVGGLELKHVPFKSGPECVAAILGGHVDFATLYLIDVKGAVEAGRLRMLAIPTEERLKDYPDIPTCAELGYPEAKLSSWYGIAAPSGVPKEISDKLKNALYKTIKHREVMKLLSKVGLNPVFKDSEEFTKFVSDTEKKIMRISKEAGIKLD
ncbi:MAG: Bug family tripartite tricarboxylate transporter substrate binding protein [Candidatus Hodarchaeota archaeon]